MKDLARELVLIPAYLRDQPTPVYLKVVQGLPLNTSSMDGHVFVEFRPYRPPARDKVASELDRFHSAVLSPGPVQLPSDTLDIFTEVKSRVQDAHRHGNGHRSRAGDDVTIVPLGTGSAMPSKYRNGRPRSIHPHTRCSNIGRNSFEHTHPDPRPG
jgi:ribonuclease Z